MLMSLNVSDDMLKHFTNDDSNTTKIISYFEKKKAGRTVVKDSLATIREEQFQQINKAADELREYIDEVKISLVQAVELVDDATAKRFIQNPTLFNGKRDNYDWINQVMLGQNGEGSATTLREKIEKFRKLACESSGNKTLNSRIENLLNTSESENENGVTISWEERNFRNNMLASALADLSTLEKNICLVEAELTNTK
jgi:hypothetical protein